MARLSPYRASRPANQSSRTWAHDWGVYDQFQGEIVTPTIFTEKFAEQMAVAMNYAFNKGREHRG